jgi:hypothetical protein
MIEGGQGGKALVGHEVAEVILVIGRNHDRTRLNADASSCWSNGLCCRCRRACCRTFAAIGEWAAGGLEQVPATPCR